MATLSDSITSSIQATGDLRKGSVEQHRAKDRKKKYRNVNMNLIGQPVSPVLAATETSCQYWNNRNKFKMPNPNANGGRSCQCEPCRAVRHHSASRSKARSERYNDGSDYDDVYPRHPDHINDWESGVNGVTYSYDLPGPRGGSQYLAQALDIAVEKHETKVFERMVKDEYEVVNSEEEGTSEEDDFELI